MAFNEFHKGFRENNQARIASKPIIKSNFGARSIDEVIKSRYQDRNIKKDIEEKKVISERTNVDYQSVNRANRNIRNLDK